MKNFLKSISASAMCKSGLLSMSGRFGSSLTILTLHRVVTEDEKRKSLNKPMMLTEVQFDSLLKAISQYGRPISLCDAVEKIRKGDSFKPGTVAVTFDDGYYDFYSRAFPLLKQYDIPATMFLTTGVIGNLDKYLWWDEFDYYATLPAGDVDRLHNGVTPDLERALQLIEQLPTDATERHEATVRDALNRVGLEDRNCFIDKIRAAIPKDRLRPQMMLTWDNVREISASIEIANHTVHHYLLDRISPQSVREEITAATEKIEQETGIQVRGMAYPAGVYTSEVSDIARECGIKYAVTTRFSNNSRNANLMSLDRKDAGYLFVGDKIEPSYYKVTVSGVLDRFKHDYTDSPGVLSSKTDQRVTELIPESVPLIVHVIYHLAVGGLENGLVNLINSLPRERFRHAIICLTDYTDFRNRIQDPDIRVFVLHKRPGKDLRIYPELWQLFRELKPDIVHTRNLSTLEAQFPAWLAGVSHRVHGEHGRDIGDLDGSRKKYQLLRRFFSPIIQRYIVLSFDLDRYLQEQVGIPGSKITHICNGVDTSKFKSTDQQKQGVLPDNFSGADTIVIGTVGRMEDVKDQINLANAFIHLVKAQPDSSKNLRLVMIGDGVLRQQALSLLEMAGLSDIVWLPGERDNVPELLGAMDVFVLPSLAEGISNTILEAMATGLPVVATDVGGNSELVVEGETGLLVPRSDPDALATAIRCYVETPGLRRRHGENARKLCEAEFSIATMVNNYQALYENLLPLDKKVSVVGATEC